MRFHPILLGAAAVATMAVASLHTEEAPPSECEQATDALAAAPPPLLSGSARRQSASAAAGTIESDGAMIALPVGRIECDERAVALAAGTIEYEETAVTLAENLQQNEPSSAVGDTPEGREGAAGEPAQAGGTTTRLSLDGLFWALRVLDDRGRPINPKGLIRVTLRPEWSPDEFVRDLDAESTSVPAVDSAERIVLARRFPIGTTPSGIPNEDQLEVLPARRLIRVQLRGWRPIEVLLPPDDIEEDNPSVQDIIRLELDDRSRASLTTRPGVGHAIPIPVERRVATGSWERTGVEGAHGVLDVHGDVLTWMGR